MKKNLPFLVVFLSVGLFILLGYFIGKPITNKMAAEQTNMYCAVSTTEIIASAQGDVYNYTGVTDYIEPESHYLTYYSVEGNTITNPVLEDIPNDLQDEQKNSALQKEAWQVFTQLIPQQDRTMVAQFNVFTDGYENTLAAVDQKKDDPTQWILEIDLADLEDKDALLFTMIHEYAHLLTLNAEQVTPDQQIVDDPYNQSLQKEKAAACKYYFTGTGCSHADSYINAFYNRFWAGINNDWGKVDSLQYNTDDLAPYYNGLFDFYLSHQDQFIDDYSTTHPTEDIAESFAYFVFSPKPAENSIKEQKVAFFYGYPELVKLREDILNGACSLE